MSWDGLVALVGEEEKKKNGYRVLLWRLKERDRWEELDVDGNGCIEWICLAQDRDKWRAFVNTVKNLRVPYNAGNFLSG
jgi:hypothetical protein